MLLMGLADKNILDLFSELDTTIGSFKCRDSIIFCISAEAGAVNAIKGASVNALRPPSLSYDVLKSRPLHTCMSGIVKSKLIYFFDRTNHSYTQWASSIATKAS